MSLLEAARSGEIQPLAPLKVTGPGRKERAYQEEIVRLARIAAEERGARKLLSRELDTAREELDLAQLIERGSARLLDRTEARAAAAEEGKARALFLAGTLQREVEGLRREVAEARGRLAALDGPRPAGFWARLLRRHA